jgi:hypothetical protein
VFGAKRGVRDLVRGLCELGLERDDAIAGNPVCGLAPVELHGADQTLLEQLSMARELLAGERVL